MASVRILGPIEAWNGERRLEIGGPRQLALLAFLVVNANRAVPADVIIESLWGSARSGSGRVGSDNRLHMAVTRLRRVLAPADGAPDGPSGAVLRTVSGGYLLALEPAELDAETFTRQIHAGITALQDGQSEAARAALLDALALWRGPPLAEVAFEDFAQAEIRRLQELRLTAVESRIEADLRLGHHAGLIGELEGLLAEDGTRERLAGQLMLALYRSGRQKEALEVFHRVRVHLGGELGLEPGPALQQLQAQILEQSPALLADQDGSPRRAQSEGARTVMVSSDPEPMRVRAPLPGRLAPHGPRAFVNRRTEHDALVRSLEQVTAAGPRVAIVTGEPGIGKTRLASEFASEAHASGMLVLGGRCDDRLELPYLPFVEALEHLVEHAPTDLLEAHVERYGDSLTRLVPGLGRRAATPPAAGSPAGEFERFALFRAVEGLLAATCDGGPVVLVLEDLHWADPGSLRLMWRLLSSPRTMPLMLLATCRVSEVAEDHPLRQFLADAHREPNVTRLDLTGLASGDVVELVRAIGDGDARGADEQLVDALESSTDGNPFFITELTRSLLESGELSRAGGRWHLDAGADVTGRLPVSISETLAVRVRRLGESARSCLGVAAVLGEEFDLDLVAEVAGSPSALDVLDLAVRRALLLEVPGRPGRFRFVHALMQRYLYRDLGSTARSELHRRAARAMQARSAEGRWASAELARHWLAAGDREWRNGLRYAALAGDEALAQLAPDKARRWYETALQLLGRQPDPPRSQLSDLLVRRGEAERQAGDLRFRETLLEAAELAQQIGDDEILVRAALANSRGMQSQTGIVDEARIAILRAALEIIGDVDSPERAHLLAMHAAELMYSPDWERRTRLSDEALAIARRLDDPPTLATVLNMRFVSLLTAGTHSERLANTIESVAAAERLRNPLARFFAYHWRGYACIEAGDIPVARTWLIREREIAEAFRQPTALWLARADEANLAIVAGDLEAADRLAAEAFGIGRQSEPDAAACFAAQRTSIAFASGRLGELAPLLAQTVAENPGVPGFRGILALAQLQAGCREEAEELLAAAAAVRFAELPRDVTWLAVMCIYAQVAAQLDDIPAAAILYELLEPFEGQLAFPAFGVWGPVALHLGSLALCGGDVAAAARHLSQARQEAEHAGAPLWQAWAESLLSQLAETAR